MDMLIKNKAMKYYTKLLSCIFMFLFILLGVVPATAEDFTSSNFILRDPVIVVGGTQSTSASFQYFSNTGQLAPGESSSTSFTYRAGSLYYPVATSPALSATAGSGQVSLTWTTSTGTLANITKYELGTATTSGGPYTFESVGNVLTYIKTGLTNGTTYYFKIKADAGDLTLVQSSEVSATPAGNTTNNSGGGGGGGGGIISVTTGVNFLGRAYPLSKVTVLKDGQVAITTIAGPDANFNIGLSSLATGNYIFSLYGEDSQGRRSTLFNFPLYITQGTLTTIGGIFIAPTIDVDKTQVARGDNIAIFGQSVPNADITIAVNSDQEFFEKLTSDKDGAYLYNFDTSPLENGQHSTKSKAALAGLISSFGTSVGFVVGKTNIIKTNTTCGKADVNCDGGVNLIDFSIEAYWYKRSSPPLKVDLNGDGKVDLVDFSIMAYYWSG